MSSTLASTTCYIKTEPYDLGVCIENDSNSISATTIDEILLLIDKLESIQFQFRSLTNKKLDDEIPKIVDLNKLLNIKQIKKSSDESISSSATQRFETKSSQLIQLQFSYIDVSETFLWTIKRLEIELDSKFAQQLCLLSNQCLSKLKNRPRNLLVFINPECGKGIGNSVYEEQVSPLFEEMNITVTTIYTERANHARDYIKENSLDEYDGLISIGGDGMFSEICHSLLLRKAEQTGLDLNDSNTRLIPPDLRIGVIPAGSTDAVAFGTTGHNDVMTNTLQIIVGESLLTDITTIHNERGFVRFMATMFTYGFFGNIIEQSDKWRFFGPLRYTLAGIVQFLRNSSYNIDLTLTQASNKSDQIKRQGHYETIICLNMPCRCDKSKFGMSPTVHLADGSFDVILVKHSWRLQFLRFLHHIANNSGAIERLSTVERFRATEVCLHPIINQEKELGNWACDGELLEAKEITIRAHHQALRLFATGINLEQIKKINEEESKILHSSSTMKPWFYIVFILIIIVILILVIINYK
ncbi:hypothetical protein I4U23_010539 [Adineta vaga]|nr:hypothetical protein I4U23_010539 [Adineta vaga]